jgi:hypothetical protein
MNDCTFSVVPVIVLVELSAILDAPLRVVTRRSRGQLRRRLRGSELERDGALVVVDMAGEDDVLVCLRVRAADEALPGPGGKLPRGSISRTI